MAPDGRTDGRKDGQTNSCSNADILTKLHINSHVTLIQNKFKFHEVLIIGYIVMVNFMKFQSIQWLFFMQYLNQSNET